MISRSRASTSTSSSTDVRNLNLQDNEGVTVGGVDGPVTIVHSDMNAIGSAEAIARDAIATGEEQTRSVLEFARDSQTGVFELAGSSLTFADRASGRALELVSEAGGRQSTTFADALDFAREVGEREQSILSQAFGQVGSTVEALNQITRAQTTSADERVADLGQKALIAGAVVAALALFMMMRR